LTYRRVAFAALVLGLSAPAGAPIRQILSAPKPMGLAKAAPPAPPQNPILSLPDAFAPGQEDDLDLVPQPSAGPRQFYFTRAAYTGYYRFRDFRSWSVDFPKADRQFLIGLKRLTNLDAYELENPVRLTDPDLGKYPFLYTVEVGYMALTEGEVDGLSRYLQAGGFLVVDDFWGTMEWENFQAQFARILPGYPIVDIPLTHPIFNCFYDVKEIVQVPNVGQGMQGGPTWESDGYYPEVKGIFDEQGRLMVVINWNTDLGDAWEWAENPYYPLRFSTYAYQMGVNYIIYAMSH
jgi:Domain of unknown function (DUF4159)